MGSTERKERERAELRTRILDVARGIVFKQGGAALTMRRIAEAIEYAPATLYQYFENREAIVRELCLAAFRELAESLAPAAAAAPDPLARLEAIGRGYVRFGLSHPETYRLMFLEDPAITSALYGPIESEDGAGRRTLAGVVATLDALKQCGRLAPEAETRVLADTFWAALHGIVSLKLACPFFPETSADVLTETMLRTLREGLLAPATATAS